MTNNEAAEPSEHTLHTVYLGLGSNLGDRHAALEQALALLGQQIHIERISSVYDTAPMLVTQQPRFLNIVCSASATQSPSELLALCKSIEQQIGRVPGPRYGPRAIDIDLLLYDDVIIEAQNLTLPHPRMAERAFVLLPLAEIAPTLQHPVLHTSIETLAAAVANADVQNVGALLSTPS